MTPTQLLGLTNDGLVTFNHVGGSAGLQVVPDLAVSLPTPTDGGTTTDWQRHPRLEPGLRLFPGPVVRADLAAAAALAAPH